jgi:hypothetical protein
MEHRIAGNAKLLDRIEAYLRLSGMSPSRFGRDVMGDPRFVQTLRQGRAPRAVTARRITLHLDALESALR